jgi:hypothetical protein
MFGNDNISIHDEDTKKLYLEVREMKPCACDLWVWFRYMKGWGLLRESRAVGGRASGRTRRTGVGMNE